MSKMGKWKALSPLDSKQDADEFISILPGDKFKVEPGLYERHRGRTTYMFG
jgi:translation initiation factor IF-1